MSQIFMCDFVCDGHHALYKGMTWLPRIGESMYFGKLNYYVENVCYESLADFRDAQNVKIYLKSKG